MIDQDNNPKNPHVFGLDMFVPFFGVVEDRNDPLTLGRCKVRIFGVHPEDKELVTTEQLPWAYPIMPIVGNAGTMGMGHAPVGPVVGTYVFGFFADGIDRQQPFFMGVIAGDGGHFNYGVNQDAPPAGNDGNSAYGPSGDGQLSGPINGLPKGSKDVTTRAAGMAAIVRQRFPKLKDHHAAALMGNMWHESGGFKAIHEIGHPDLKGIPANQPPPRWKKGAPKRGYGWAQWTADRLNYFLDYADKNHLKYDSDEAQLGYFLYELSGSVPGVPVKKYMDALYKGGTHSAPSTPKGPHNVDTIEGATGYFMGWYERPASADSLGTRIGHAKQTLAAMNKAGVPVRSSAKQTDPANISSSAGMFVGDSIAVRVGSAAKITTNATVGWDSAKILSNYGGKYGKDYTVISVGTNDWGTGNWETTKSNIQKIRAGIKSSKVCWIVPNTKEVTGKNSKQIAGMRKAAEIVRTVAGGDKRVELSNYTCSDGLHPDNGGAVWADIKKLLGV
jgi:hypothetical protein